MESAIKSALGTSTLKATGRGGGGCISSGSSYLTDSGTIFVKVNSKPDALKMFKGEKAGLDAILSTGSVKCPKPLGIVEHGSTSALIMENMDMTSLTSKGQAQLGENLARMHLFNAVQLEKAAKEGNRIGPSDPDGDTSIDFSRPVDKFGFYVPTCCGYIGQDNSWQDDWTAFYVRQKLQLQVDLLLAEKGDRELNDVWPLCRQKVEDQLGKLKGSMTPALVHGDLWSGNVASVENEPVIFDPASFFGHSEFDFGIARMFGGFSSQFYSAYFQIIPKTEGFSERQDIYELFHHLNHWNHFGSGYKSSTISLMRKISKF